MSKLVYKCEDYIIEEIPLNYRATIKCSMNPKEKYRGIGTESYTHLEHGLEYAKEIVEYIIKEYFISGTKPQQFTK